jgi:hypothetical protein
MVGRGEESRGSGAHDSPSTDADHNRNATVSQPILVVQVHDRLIIETEIEYCPDGSIVVHVHKRHLTEETANSGATVASLRTRAYHHLTLEPT